MKHNYLAKYSLSGALTGFLVFHPLVILVSYFMATCTISGNVSGNFLNLQGIISQVQKSFNPAMLPWSLSFVLLCGVISFYIGKIKQTNKEKEELIVNLRKALAEVKTLSGLLPICSSCKKIRDDDGYWQQIEEYIRDHSNADFTHGICIDCVEKLYPEFYPEFKEKMGTSE